MCGMELQADLTYQQTGDPNRYTNVRPFEIGHALIPTFYEVRATRFST